MYSTIYYSRRFGACVFVERNFQLNLNIMLLQLWHMVERGIVEKEEINCDGSTNSGDMRHSGLLEIIDL